MDLRLERRAVGVVPRVVGDVAAVDEHRRRVPVVHLARQEVAAFEQQQLLARRGERVRERSSARTRTDDDDVVTLAHDASYRPGLQCMSPPSANTVVAFRYAAPSPARKVTTLPISCGSAMRPSGMALSSVAI